MVFEMLDRRRAGVLLHPTSLPGPFDFGVLGTEARRFIDFLAGAGFTLWQTLPLGPVDDGLSPYRVRSSRAGNPRLIDPSCADSLSWTPSRHLWESAKDWRDRKCALPRLYESFRKEAPDAERRRFGRFLRTERDWLLPYGLFESLKERFDHRPWWEWPSPLRRLEASAVLEARRENRALIRRYAFEQYLFQRQWQSLRTYAHSRGVWIFGDLPIYLDRDSVEVWSNRDLFLVDDDGQASVVAGVPPDYFSADGQLWGNPIYDWERMKSDGFRWWIDRLRHQLGFFDSLRIDHFRALESYWEVPGDATTARVGQWRPGPGAALFEAIRSEVPLGSLVAEDLGLITPEVYALRDQYGLPGMLVLQFAFDGNPGNPFLPNNHAEHAVVYTGTHDNDTTLGWYRSLDSGTRAYVDRCLGTETPMPWALVRTALESRARTSILPMQDILELGSSGRMNTPGTTTGNWTWRFRWEEVKAETATTYRELMATTGRR